MNQHATTEPPSGLRRVRKTRPAITGLLALLLGAVGLTMTAATTSAAQTTPPPTWNQLGSDIDGENDLDNSGRAVAMSADGNTIIIGAADNDDNGSSSGHARIYRNNGTDWTQLGTDLNGENPHDDSGEAVAMSADGNTVIIGAARNDDNGSSSGHARIHRFNGTDWTQLGNNITGEDQYDYSGWAVAMSADGNTVIIGAPLNDDNGDTSGHARVYQYTGTDWTQLGTDIDGESPFDHSGRAVAMSADGNTVIIGAPLNDDNGDTSGHARIHRFNGTDWTQLGTDINGESQNGNSGWAVAMSADGDTVIIGAPAYFDGIGSSGQARIYRFNGTDWTQLGTDIDGQNPGDRFGESVAMSADGNTVIIGASENDGNRGNSGHARIYRYNGTDWTQVGTDINGENLGDHSGRAVAMSADGNTIIIGADHNDANQAYNGNSGHARVFTLDPTCGGARPTIDMADGSSGTGTAGADVILGTSGPDRIFGFGGDDIICGGDGIDRINGGDGNDTIHGDGGSDRIYAGTGNDIVHGGSGADRIYGQNGHDTLGGNGGQDRIFGGNGNDTIQGSQQSDTLNGNDGNDTIRGAKGKDTINGGNGNDDLYGGDNTDTINGGNGTDTIDGQRGIDNCTDPDPATTTYTRC